MAATDYIPTIGLEIHAELKTASKMFCSCKNDPDEEKPNENICPICLAHPGTLPILNHDALRHIIRIGIALEGVIADFTEWDRKHYYYPDIPKGYQLSQYKYPLISGGNMAGIRIERIHLEEDTARSTHDTHEKSLVDFNRSGIPLMELVTKPVIHDAKTAVTFARELQLLLRYLKAGEANMEKGEMRVEANVSMGPILIDSKKSVVLGTKVEVKNLNSFKAVKSAIEYEILRQTSLLDQGRPVTQETRGWDDVKEETYSQRSKESSHDYRYYPDPDIPKMKLREIAELSVESLRASLPELPWMRRERLKSEYGVTDEEVAIFVESDQVTEYFEDIISAFKADAKRIRLTINYLLSDYLGALKSKKTKFDPRRAISPSSFADMITMIKDGVISSRGAKDLIGLLMTSPNGGVRDLVERNNLVQKSALADLEPAIYKVLTDNAIVVGEYRSGKIASLQYLVGQVMKATKGSGNPEAVKKLLLEKLSRN